MALAGVNLLATPGLGTMLGGRVWAGVGELSLSGSGFTLIMLWFLDLFQTAFKADGASAPASGWKWKLGLALFAFGWLASAWSSLEMVRAATAATPPPLAVPPKIDGSAG